MTVRKFLFTSESVTEGHPDKICDQISDAILDECIKGDENSHVACECYVTTGMALIGGEITTKVYVDVQKIVRKVIKKIGYTDAKMGFDYNSIAVLNVIREQSPDIAQGVNRKNPMDQGAGDQGIMFGYATNETEEYMPLTTLYAHQLTQKLAEVRKNGTIPYLRPDGKSQVTIEYEIENGIEKPLRLHAVVIAAQHNEKPSYEEINNDILEHVIKPVCGDMYTKETKIYINQTGRFVIGGPHGDTGLTGRKIIVDTYGGVGSHGGGCFSGKDPSKVDRSGSYAARWIAKNIVAAGFADRCEIQLGYAIGVAEPVSINVNCFQTEHIPEEDILEAIKKTFDLRPAAIIEALDLKRPIYQKTSCYGHFGRKDPDFTWEKINKVEELKANVK